MENIFGDFVECNTSNEHEFLMLRFPPTSIPLQFRWNNNNLAANFMANYLSGFFYGEDEQSINKRENIKDSVNFIANELLENAMKFNFPENKYSITLYVGIKSDYVMFYASNSVDVVAVEAWQHKIKQILTEDTRVLFMQQVTNNEAKGNSDSGLGYLSMINDWNARLAWKFKPIKNETKAQRITVMVQLPQS